MGEFLRDVADVLATISDFKIENPEYEGGEEDDEDE